jgi:hypothetical protein
VSDKSGHAQQQMQKVKVPLNKRVYLEYFLTIGPLRLVVCLRILQASSLTRTHNLLLSYHNLTSTVFVIMTYVLHYNLIQF